MGKNNILTYGTACFFTPLMYQGKQLVFPEQTTSVVLILKKHQKDPTHPQLDMRYKVNRKFSGYKLPKEFQRFKRKIL